LNEEYKQVDCWFNECKVKLEGRDLEEKGILPENDRNHEGSKIMFERYIYLTIVIFIKLK
jgi:hypothetical protein